jgi:hypothetical protein
MMPRFSGASLPYAQSGNSKPGRAKATIFSGTWPGRFGERRIGLEIGEGMHFESPF